LEKESTADINLRFKQAVDLTPFLLAENQTDILKSRREDMKKIWRKPFDLEQKATARSQISIDKERCKGCGYCVEYCPREVLEQTKELSPKGYLLVAVKDESKCVACGFCEAICPEFAIKVTTPQKAEQTAKP
jgi:2-oxoglutarate ferredoxin oxidoreductase subunit delta